MMMTLKGLNGLSQILIVYHLKQIIQKILLLSKIWDKKKVFNIKD